jgi:hypothetical protein
MEMGYKYYDSYNEIEVVGIDRTPEWESCYAYTYELWRNAMGRVFYASWHGGVNSGGWDVWEVPAELWPYEDEAIEAAVDAAAELVNRGAVKVKDCPYCDDLGRGA